MKMNRTEKITEACNKINASKSADGNGYIYRADETDEWYRITEDELVELSDLMHSDDEDVAREAYSHWCNCTGELIGDDNAAFKLGLIAQ
jgi:hypothetical protein